MKKILLLSLALYMFNFASAKKVQFSVDMTGQVKSALGIQVIGDFQSLLGLGLDFTPDTSCIMTQDVADTNLFHFTIDLPAFTKFEYKFVNGDQTYEAEIVPVESQVDSAINDNRWIYIDSLNADTMKLAPVIFSLNSPAGLTMIRFVVDMTLQTVSTNGVHVAGNFQGNDPSTHRMYSFKNNKYEIISYMIPGNYTYKFYNGNMASNSETVPTACSSSGERSITQTNDIFLNSVCFSSCSNCFPSAIEESKQIHFNLFPNPMSRSTIVQFEDQELVHHLSITDLSGRLIFRRASITESSYLLHDIDLSQGIYMIAVESGSGKRNSSKLIVE